MSTMCKHCEHALLTPRPYLPWEYCGVERKILRACSVEPALLLVASAIPSDPPLLTTVVAAVLKRTRFTLLFFLSALVLVNFLGMA
jgi:hypothetical protein